MVLINISSMTTNQVLEKCYILYDYCPENVSVLVVILWISVGAI
jgi:hypothetical protein